jgi:hypothetical protein
VVVLGDFNLIRGQQDKNNANINWGQVNAFNDCIARLALREIACSGARFTWSNMQCNPVHCVLDRALVSREWEMQFPGTSLLAIHSIGSDHTPLLLDTGESLQTRSTRFFFQTSWFELEGFREMINQWWFSHASSINRSKGPIDWWRSQTIPKGLGSQPGES